jgi:hypothetical protein
VLPEKRVPDLIAYVRKNQIDVMNLKSMRTSSGSASFTTTRLLVGNFEEAEKLLTRLVKEVRGNGFFLARPRLLIQPLEMTEGGLSMVEERVLLELGASAGARHVKVHVGQKLVQQASDLDQRA